MATAEAKGEKKFAHLLQPIRSLSDNWDIDIATELEDYLDDLEELTFTFEDGPSLNFAEAALLIQGSACVYSRKVEYLHSLVYRALDVIADTRRRQNRSKSGAQDGIHHDMEDDATFLNLDATIEDGGNIDLDERSLKEAAAALRPPPALLALEDAGANSTGRSEEAGNFKIAYCHVHPSGALLLEQHECGDLQAGPHELHFPHEAVPSPGPAEDAQFGEIGAEEDDWQDEGDVAMAGEMAPQDEAPAEGFLTGEAASPCQDEGEAFQHGADATEVPPAAEGEAEEAEPYDPYKPLDMYDGSGHKARPFRRLRIRSRPAPGGQAAEREDGDSMFPVPDAPVSGCTFPEFDYALEAIRLADIEAARKSKSRMQALEAHEQLASCFTAGEGAPADVESDHEDTYQDLEDGPFEDAPEGFEQLDEWAEAQEGRHAFGGTEHCLDGGATETLSYEELCKAHMDAFIAAAAAAETQTELASRVAGWQSRIEPALEAQEAQGVFDIHEYGERILDNLADATQATESAVTFDAAVVGCQRHEVSRAFSAMLQLINNGNVVIHKGEDTDAPFTLQVITSELAHKQMGVSGALGLLCNGAAVTKAAAAREQDENVSGNAPAEIDGRSPVCKAPRTAGGAARGRGRAAAAAK
eukprot:jgi/Tetstr1/458836/TSEL_045219.t1